MGIGSAFRLRNPLKNDDTSSDDSSITASPRANGTSYDVFLSFRGDDTRDSFTDHLYAALVRAGLRTFRDDDEIDRGQDLKPAIKKAIRASEASIIVLSEKYATSTWCLDELWLILEQRRVCNHFVLPVFYHVGPADVRKQTKSFKIEVKTSTRWTNDNVNRWKEALTKVANLTGLVLSGSETKFLKDIVDTVYNKLDRKQIYLPPNLIGMDSRDKEINSWLEESDAEFLAICGMGGSGKTTLATHIVYSNWKKFENISIVENIGSICKEQHDFLPLQEKLLRDISRGKNLKIPSVCQGTFLIEEVLQTKKALIVLDDIVEPNQLVALLGSSYINKQTKIIITTRENNIGKWFESKSWRYRKYNMKLLNDDEALELLSLHAFGSKILEECYVELAKQILRYCEGNPLALQLLGSSLFVSAEELPKRNNILFWKSTLNLLEGDFHSGIQRVVRRSYDSLPHESNKDLFLHVACFFVGKDVDYVVEILEQDYFALSGIKILSDRCLLSISPNKKLMMHRLIQEMGRKIVYEESPKDPAKRSRIWRNGESYDVLKKGKGTQTIEGLALDMEILSKENVHYEPKLVDIDTDSLKKMDNLKLLRLNGVELTGSYEYFPEHLIWLCWVAFHLQSIPSDLFIGNLVALDMSYSSLKVFEPPMDLQSLKILNLKSSWNLSEIRNISRLPNLETLILWDCYALKHVCNTLGELKSLVLLNMNGCENLYRYTTKSNTIFLIDGRPTTEPSFYFPHSLKRLFFKGCNLKCTDHFLLSFRDQSYLQYLNLGNSLFEVLPRYNHLKNLRVLDLSLCHILKRLLCLPSTLAELYVYYCLSLEKVTFESHRFSLQEFGYEGCINLSEVEGLIKLVPIAKLNETNLRHMKWLKEYENHRVCLVGDDELTKGRSWCIQMLYEFDIMSTSLPDVNDPNMTPQYMSESQCLSFDVPSCSRNRILKGLNVTFKYTSISGEDGAWFVKISTTNGVDLMYNPKVFGKPNVGEVGIWLSYWPIGNALNVGDKVNVSIVVISGLEIHECGASLVYADDEVANRILKNNMKCTKLLGRDLSGFQLSSGAYYLCRRDFFELTEVERLTPEWFRILVGDTIDYTEVRGWRKTGRPQQSNQSFTELKMVRCIVHGPESEEVYNISEMYKSSFVDKSVEFTSSSIKDQKDYDTTSEHSKLTLQDQKESYNLETMGIAKAFGSDEILMPTSSHHTQKRGSVTDEDSDISFEDTLGRPPVASSSLSTIASPSEERRSFDVYLTFEPFDVEYFGLNLNEALLRSRLHVFPFFQLLPEVAPTEMRASIIILSESYVRSSRYLDTLLLILKQRRNYNHFVLPVFYDIESSRIRELKGFFLQTLKRSRLHMGKVDSWYAALTEVANLPSINVMGTNDNDEAIAIEEIVSTVQHALHSQI